MSQKAKKLNFTKAILEALPAPPYRVNDAGRKVSQTRYYYDRKAFGLALSVSSGGRRVFLFYRSIAGRPVKRTLGRLDGLTIEQARRRVAELNSKDPATLLPGRSVGRITAKSTLQDLWNYYSETYGREHKRSYGNELSQWTRHLAPQWGRRRLDGITTGDVKAWYSKLAKRHVHQANRTKALLRMLYNFAKSEGGYTGDNPAVFKLRSSERKKVREHSRRRFLQADELRPFFKALQTEPALYQDLFRFLLYTGVRKGCAQSLKWSDADLVQGVWTIRQTKTDDQVAIPLCRPALDILKARRKTRGDNEFVFPGVRGTPHVREIRSSWKRIVDAAGITDLRPHDLRRSLASWMLRTGANHLVIGVALTHAVDRESITAIYSRPTEDLVREAVQRAVEAMLIAAGERQPAEVISLRG